jgi:hypothetical protein
VEGYPRAEEQHQAGQPEKRPTERSDIFPEHEERDNIQNHGKPDA